MDEKEWQAEQDMRIMKEAEQIEMNPKRVANAKRLARKKANELMAFAEDRDDMDDAKMVMKGYTKP